MKWSVSGLQHPGPETGPAALPINVPSPTFAVPLSEYEHAVRPDVIVTAAMLPVIEPEIIP